VDTLDDVLDRLDALDDAGDDAQLRAVLDAARVRFPDAPELREWQASLAAGEERFDDALAILDAVLAADPKRLWARRERAAVLLDLGRFEDALAQLRTLRPRDLRQLDADERASVHYDLGLCLDRLAGPAEADVEFRRAQHLAPRDFPAPLRLSEERFEAIAAAALDDIPQEFTRHLDQVVVRVRDYPAPDDEDPFLLGLYVGVARPNRSVATADHLDHVLVFKRPHELRCEDEDALREEVRRTLVHEIAHHFGIVHEDMGDYR
jgi:predicted Zn-dependent protease with MMP-like domain